MSGNTLLPASVNDFVEINGCNIRAKKEKGSLAAEDPFYMPRALSQFLASPVRRSSGSRTGESLCLRAMESQNQ